MNNKSRSQSKKMVSSTDTTTASYLGSDRHLVDTCNQKHQPSGFPKRNNAINRSKSVSFPVQVQVTNPLFSLRINITIIIMFAQTINSTIRHGPKRLLQQPQRRLVSAWYSTTNGRWMNSSTGSTVSLYNSLSFATPEESETSYIHSMLSPQEQQLWSLHAHRIRTLQDVFLSDQACVVTTMTEPHLIVAVNPAWTAICGYTAQEVHHRSISSLLHGPLTNERIIQDTMRRVQESILSSTKNTTDEAAVAAAQNDEQVQEEDMYVVNYTKDRTSFINHVTLSKIQLSFDQPNIQFLLGIIQPVTHVPLRMVV
jgi:PAS domain-containing protein